MIVLGINAFGHDAAAVLLRDGVPAYAASQERLDRVRHSGAFPADAIRAALDDAGLVPRDVDRVAFPWTRGMGRLPKAVHVLRGLPRTRAFLRPPTGADAVDRRGYLRAMRAVGGRLRALGVLAPLDRVPHHLAHAVSATLAHDEDEPLAVITADGMGEWVTAALWVHAHGRLRRLEAATFPHSPGKAYAAVTQWLGFRPESDEGKTMGLAAYGDPDAPGARFARDLVRPRPGRVLEVALRRFDYPWGSSRRYGDAFVEALGPARRPDEPLRPGDADVARGAQDALEATFLDAARRVLARTGARRLGLAGGVFLSCALNGHLARHLDADVRPFPVAGDAGAAWGAAAWVHRQRTGRAAARLATLRLGHRITDAEVRAAAPAADARPGDLAEHVAARIADGGLVAVARGRAELGPRALGGRSLLGSPRTIAARDHLNAHKGREPWRPLAPVVRAADAGWFGATRASPWMILTCVASASARAAAPGAVHADGTARLQTVGPDGAPFLHAVLDALARRGEPPVVLNTSLNRPGEPIVDTAAQALATARALGVDAVVLGDAWLDL